MFCWFSYLKLVYEVKYFIFGHNLGQINLVLLHFELMLA